MTQSTRRALGRGLASLLDGPGAPEDDVETGPAKSENRVGLGTEHRGSERAETERTPASRRAAETDVAQLAAEKIPIDMVISSAEQPRKYFDDALLNDLADSIREKGVIQPILVRPLPGREGRYEIVAGERRWRAAQRAKLHEIPAVIRDMDDAGALEIGLIENVQRSDLNAMEEAYGYRALMDRFDYTQETLAKNIGKSRSHIANIMRLVNLPRKVQDLVRSGDLSAGHGRALLGAEDPDALAQKIVRGGLSVRQAERMSKGESGEPRPKSSGRQGADADTRALEGILSVALRLPVTIKHLGEHGGEVRIGYRTLDDLEELATLLQGQADAGLAGDR
ncbi:MAG: ParB/RepB/Spo0J family partition protein [Pseudomonadota bacterium]